MAHINQTAPLILASTSPWRKEVLESTGLTFSCIAPQVDEENLKPSLHNLPVAEQAMALALYKGKDISLQNPDAYILCGDQIGATEGYIYEKPYTNAQAIKDLLSLSGKKLTYYTAAALLKNGKIIWQNVLTPSVTFRDITKEEVIAYVELEDVTGICGSCETKGIGQHLLSSKDGDFSAILGLPMAEILTALHHAKVVSLKKES